MPAAANSERLYVSTKNPLLSASTRGSIRSTSGIARLLKSNGILFEYVEQISPIAACHCLGEAAHVIGRDVAHAIRDFFETRHHQPLPFFNALHEVGGMQQRFVRACVEPRDAASKAFDVQLATLEIGAIHVGNLELSTRRRLQ